MKRLNEIFVVLLGLALFAALAVAQDAATGQSSASSKNAQGNGATNTGDDKGQQGDGQDNGSMAGKAKKAATTSVTSTRSLLFGGDGEMQDSLTPSFHYSHGATSNPCENSDAATCGGFYQTDAFGLTAALRRAGRRHSLALAYDGGGTYYYAPTSASASNFRSSQQFHAVDFMESYQLRHFSLSLANGFSYSPDATFGFAGNSFAGSFDSGLVNSVTGTITSAAAALQPGQTILTGNNSRYTDTTSMEVGWQPTLKDSFTWSGSYGLMRFPDHGFLDGDQSSLSAGYSRRLNRWLTAGLQYQYGLFWYQASPVDIKSHSGSGILGITFRNGLSLRVGGGPQYYVTEDAPASPLSAGARLSWGGMAEAAYHYRRSTFSASYMHGLTSGSGVFLGAKSDTVSGGFSHPLARQWDLGINAGYSRNLSLIVNPLFNSEFRANFVGANINRTISRQLSANFSYSMQWQNVSVFCVGAACNGNPMRYSVSAGLNWSPTPIRIK